MFNAKKGIKTTQANIDKIVAIKSRISNELQGFTGNMDTEWTRLFNLYTGQDKTLRGIKNI